MAIEQRFRVHRSGDVVHLHGVMSDTTNFRVIDEMLQGCRYFDCSQILTASWNGLINFNRYLRETQQNITLTNVPNHIFNYLRLMPDVNNSYTLDQIELNVVDLTSQELATKNVFISSEQLRKLSDECSRAFLRLSQKEELVGKNNFICPARFGEPPAESSSSRSTWYQQHSQEFDFWYDYCNFSNITSYLALDLVESLSSTLSTLLKEIHLGIASAVDATQQLDPANSSLDYGNDVNLIIDGIKSSCQELSTELDQTSKQGKEFLLKMQILADDPGFTSKDQLYQILQNFSSLIIRVENILPKIEDVGANTGANIGKLGITNVLRQVITQIGDEQVDQETLASIRETLEIMDPLSEDSWPDTREEFLAQLDSIDKAISDTIILVQGFDLLRQILEHRLAEAREIASYLGNEQQSSWEHVRDRVFEMVGKTLVTDQEKYSCEFFLPDAAASQEEKQSPGDVLLF